MARSRPPVGLTWVGESGVSPNASSAAANESAFATLGGALAAGLAIGGAAGTALLDAARAAFTDGLEREAGTADIVGIEADLIDLTDPLRNKLGVKGLGLGLGLNGSALLPSIRRAGFSTIEKAL